MAAASGDVGLLITHNSFSLYSNQIKKFFSLEKMTVIQFQASEGLNDDGAFKSRINISKEEKSVVKIIFLEGNLAATGEKKQRSHRAC